MVDLKIKHMHFDLRILREGEVTNSTLKWYLKKFDLAIGWLKRKVRETGKH